MPDPHYKRGEVIGIVFKVVTVYTDRTPTERRDHLRLVRVKGMSRDKERVTSVLIKRDGVETPTPIARAHCGRFQIRLISDPDAQDAALRLYAKTDTPEWLSVEDAKAAILAA